MSTDKTIVVPFSGTYGNSWFEFEQEIDCTFNELFEEFAKQYVAEWNDEFNYQTDINLGLEYDGTDSPKEYNFMTDRIFAKIPEAGWRALQQTVEAIPKNRKIMDDIAAKRHTSRDGFISFYDPDWESWGPVIGWDHNQMETLLLAVMQIKGVEQYEMEDGVMDVSCVREAIENHVIYEEEETNK